MIERFLEWWSDRLPGRLISLEGVPYLERYFVRDIQFSIFGRTFRRSIYLHRILMGDTDRGLHNHPWDPAWSIILHGWYKEVRVDHLIDISIRAGNFLHMIAPVNFVLKNVRYFNRLGSKVFHRIIMDPETSPYVWTLFVRGPDTNQGWGFVYADPRHKYQNIKLLRYRQYEAAKGDDPDDRQFEKGIDVKSHRRISHGL